MIFKSDSFDHHYTRILADAAYNLLIDPELIGLSWGDGLTKWDGVPKYCEAQSAQKSHGGNNLLEKVAKQLDSLLKFPESTTERMRYRQQIVDCLQSQSPPPQNQSPWRINYLWTLVKDQIVFNGPKPTVKLTRFRNWRDLCYRVDEEILVSLAIAVALEEKYKNLKDIHRCPSAFVGDLFQILLSWPTFLHPLDQDFTEIIKQGLSDAHIHFGERFPAPLIWRAMMDGRHEPSQEEVKHVWENVQASRPHFDYLKERYLGRGCAVS